MRGINIFEQAHLVNAIPPINGTGGKSTDVWHMKYHRWANIILQIGVSAAAATKILVFGCTDAAGTNPTAIPFTLYKEETALGDTLSAKEAVTAAGYTPSANDNIMYGILVDASELPDDKPYMYVQVTNGTNSVILSAVAILTGARYSGSATGETVIT